MSLSQPSGLSAVQKRKLKQNEPTMDDVTGIPEAVATEADLSLMIEELASTDSGKGASCIGYEGGTTVQAQVAANTSAISALGGGGNTGFDAETAGAGGKMELYEATANGTNKVTMASPASLAADRTITVPDADVALADIATNTAAIAAATTDTGAGAGNSGKLVELDGDGRLDGRDIGADGTKLDGIEALADVTDLANVTTALSVTAATAVATSAGAGDAGKLAKLDAGGKWDSTMIPATAPAAHAASHTNGTDDIQDATAGQKGLATAAQITKLDGIETAADVTDLANVTTALGVTAATAVTSTTGGAGNDGKAIKLDASGKVDGYSATDWGQIAANTADLAATAATNLGITRHVKITTPGGATANTDKALPPGTWEVVDVWFVHKGGGAGGDTVQLLKSTGGAITEVMTAASPDKTVIRASEIDDSANTLIGGTDDLRVTETDGGAGAPALDVHVLLRLIA